MSSGADKSEAAGKTREVDLLVRPRDQVAALHPTSSLLWPSAAKELGVELPEKEDPINPSHYTQGAIECIDALEAMMTREEFVGFLRGQVVKYQWRLGRKDSSSQDAKKSAWYLARLVQTLDKK